MPKIPLLLYLVPHRHFAWQTALSAGARALHFDTHEFAASFGSWLLLLLLDHCQLADGFPRLANAFKVLLLACISGDVNAVCSAAGALIALLYVDKAFSRFVASVTWLAAI